MQIVSQIAIRGFKVNFSYQKTLEEGFLQFNNKKRQAVKKSCCTLTYERKLPGGSKASKNKTDNCKASRRS